MKLTIQDIQILVNSRESASLELKETTGQLTRGMESGCAFMNGARGGFLPQEVYHELLKERYREQYRWEAFANRDLTTEMLDKEKILATIRLGIEYGRLPESAIEQTDVLLLLDKLNLTEGGLFRNAAAVLFSKNTRGFFPQLRLRLARFRGNDRSEFLDNAQLEGNLFELFDAAMLFLFKHLSLSGKIKGTEREEVLSIPHKALRESVVNAFCHRDYAQPGGSVGIAIYDDRVEILNTGHLPKDINVGNLVASYKSMPNNPLIANVLYRRKMVESWGRGLELMYSACIAAGLPAPTLREVHGEVIVTYFLTEQVTE